MDVDLVGHRKAIPVKGSGLQLHDSLRRLFALERESFKLGAGNGHRLM